MVFRDADLSRRKAAANATPIKISVERNPEIDRHMPAAKGAGLDQGFSLHFLVYARAIAPLCHAALTETNYTLHFAFEVQCKASNKIVQFSRERRHF
jgi:hypothetical protein